MKNEKKFIASFSGGKDSILAIYRAINTGFKPVVLLTTYNEKNEYSWFHNIPHKVLHEIANSLNVPLHIVKTDGENYTEEFEKALLVYKNKGADICVFGDIDIQEHQDWCNDRCKNVGIKSLFPLWKCNRKDLVYEFIDAGFKAKITVLDMNRMDKSFLGEVLSKKVALNLENSGVDVCGENGEYHTIVFNGPIFTKEVSISFGEPTIANNYIRLPILNT